MGGGVGFAIWGMGKEGFWVGGVRFQGFRGIADCGEEIAIGV